MLGRDPDGAADVERVNCAESYTMITDVARIRYRVVLVSRR